MAWLRFAWLSLSAQQAWASSSCYFRSVGPACWRDNELLLLLLLRHLQYTGIKKHRTAPAGNVKYATAYNVILLYTISHAAAIIPTWILEDCVYDLLE